MSPPSPQRKMMVRSTAIQFGGSRISREMLFAGIMIIALVIVVGLIAYIIYHGYHIRRRNKRFRKEIREVEEVVRHDFTVLRQDIGEELKFIGKLKMSRALSEKEKVLEERLLRDMDRIERQIDKEILDVEKLK